MKKSATQLLNEMNTLQNKLALTICKCGKHLRTYDQFGRTYGECVDKSCRRVAVTLTVIELAALSNEDLDAAGYPDYSVQATKVA
jgi:hypothetical protein